ncbi:hypothetical protein ACHQM5_024746 [Ranunculus cassubicifolius]
MRRKPEVVSIKLRRFITMVSCSGRRTLLRTDSRIDIQEMLKSKLCTIVEEDVEKQSTNKLEKKIKKKKKRSSNQTTANNFTLLTDSYLQLITKLTSRAMF